MLLNRLDSLTIQVSLGLFYTIICEIEDDTGSSKYPTQLVSENSPLTITWDTSAIISRRVKKVMVIGDVSDNVVIKYTPFNGSILTIVDIELKQSPSVVYSDERNTIEELLRLIANGTTVLPQYSVFNGDASNQSVPTTTPLVNSINATDGSLNLQLNPIALQHLERGNTIHFMADGSINLQPLTGQKTTVDGTEILAYDYQAGDDGRAIGYLAGSLTTIPVGGGGLTWDVLDYTTLTGNVVYNLSSLPDRFYIINNTFGQPNRTIEIYIDDYSTDKLVMIDNLPQGSQRYNQSQLQVNSPNEPLYPIYYPLVSELLHWVGVKNGSLVAFSLYTDESNELYKTQWSNV